MNINAILAISTNVFVSLFIIFTVLPVKLNYSSIVIFVLIALSIVSQFYKENLVKGKTKLFLISVPFFVYAIGLINTSNIAVGIDYVTRNASYLAFPFIFFSLGNHIKKNTALKVYLIALSLVNSYLIYLFIHYFNFGARFYMIVTNDIYHSTYLGMYNIIAYWICTTLFLKAKPRSYSLLLLSLFFMASAMATSSRIIFIIGALSLIVASWLVITSIKVKIIALLVILGLTLGAIQVSPSIKQKFDEIARIDQMGFDKDNYRSVSSRFAKLQASLSVIKKNLFFGTGTGDLMDNLMREYESMQFTMGYKYQYNTHNQFLSNVARNGLLGGGVCLIALFLFPLYKSLTHKDLCLTSFVLVVGVVCLTESVLDVHKGITFYAFFLTLLMHDQCKESPEHGDKQDFNH